MIFRAFSSSTTSSSRICQLRENASKLNNQGVLFLKEGDLAHARECFHRSLTLLKLFVKAQVAANQEEEGQFSRPEKDNVAIEALPPSTSLAFFSSISGGGGVVKETRRRTFASSTDLFTTLMTVNFHRSEVSAKDTSCRPASAFIHSEAIPIPLPEERISFLLDTNLDERLCIAICIFNLALIHHLQGIGGTPSSSSPTAGRSNDENAAYKMRMMNIAHSFYNKCKCLLFGVGFHGCGLVNAHPTADLVAMAVLNNQALINYYEHYDFVQANNNANSLLHVVSMVQPYCYGNEQIAVILVQAQTKFVLNAFVLQKTPTTAHAA